MSTPTIRRFRGFLMLMDWPKCKKQRTVGIDRAILRAGQLAMDFSEGTATYSVVLRRKAGHRVFAGEWKRVYRGTKRGGAECELKGLSPNTSQDDDVLLAGQWFEDGIDWRWGGLLVPVESFQLDGSEE